MGLILGLTKPRGVGPSLCGRRAACVAALGLAAMGALGGCDRIIGIPFPPGPYAADVPCTLGVVDAAGAEGQQEFTSPTTLTIGADGGIRLNGVELAVGQEVVRSIPTADLAFEITEIAREGCALIVTSEPRPTLPGIAMTGELVETYRWQAGSVHASARADLLVTDVAGTVAFTVECAGTLH